MSAVETIYLMVGGRYRKRRGRIDTSQPTFLINGADKMAHSLREDPIFIRTDPIRLFDWTDLTGAEAKEPLPPPAPPDRAERVGVICEDNAIWPISSVPFTDELSRQQEMADTHQEALNLAEAKQARDRHGNWGLQAGFLALVSICLILVVIIGGVVLNHTVGKDKEPMEPKEPAASSYSKTVTMVTISSPSKYGSWYDGTMKTVFPGLILKDSPFIGIVGIGI
jgi:hypothetical protein